MRRDFRTVKALWFLFVASVLPPVAVATITLVFSLTIAEGRQALNGENMLAVLSFAIRNFFLPGFITAGLLLMLRRRGIALTMRHVLICTIVASFMYALFFPLWLGFFDSGWDIFGLTPLAFGACLLFGIPIAAAIWRLRPYLGLKFLTDG